MPRMSVIQEVKVRVLEDEVRLYRATWKDGDPAQLDSFRSHYELQRPPRGPEVRAAVIHMAVSMFETAEPCWALIDRTRGRIGDHVVELRLVPGRSVCAAKTGGPLHWSVWGDPAVLRLPGFEVGDGNRLGLSWHSSAPREPTDRRSRHGDCPQ